MKNSRREICGYGFQWFCPGGWLTKEYSVLICDHCGIRIAPLLRKLRLLRNSKTSRCRFTGIRNCPGCYLTSALSTGDAWFLFCIGMAEKYWHLVAVFQELDKDKTKIIDSKWTVDNEIADRSELSEELANFCPQYPIYQVKMMDDSLTVTRVETEGESRTEKFEMRIPKKNRRLNCVRAFLLTFVNFWSEPMPSCSLKELKNEKYIDTW